MCAYCARIRDRCVGARAREVTRRCGSLGACGCSKCLASQSAASLDRFRRWDEVVALEATREEAERLLDAHGNLNLRARKRCSSARHSCVRRSPRARFRTLDDTSAVRRPRASTYHAGTLICDQRCYRAGRHSQDRADRDGCCYGRASGIGGQRTMWSRRACHSASRMGTAYSCSKRPGALRVLAVDAVAGAAPLEAHLAHGVLDERRLRQRVAVAHGEQRPLDRLVDEAPRPHLARAQLLEHVEPAHQRVGIGVPAAPRAVVLVEVAAAALLEDVVPGAGPRELVDEVGHGYESIRSLPRAGLD